MKSCSFLLKVAGMAWLVTLTLPLLSRGTVAMMLWMSLNT